MFAVFSLTRHADVFTGCKTSSLSKCLRHPKKEPCGSTHPNALQFAADVTKTDPRARRRYKILRLKMKMF